MLLEREGIEGLDALAGIGPVLAQAIAQMVRTGRWAQLERLRGGRTEQLFQTIPGLGPELAGRIHEHLDIETLEALELAACTTAGSSRCRASARGGRLCCARPSPGCSPAHVGPDTERAVEPGVDLLLDVDREYREKAERGALPKIAPRRFNPSGEAWLPILHTERGDRGFTALFSNTALAHALRRVRDWVVIYFHEDSGPEGQRTVVTETRRPLAGQRVVRGRETECFALPDPAGEPPREIGRRDGSC